MPLSEPSPREHIHTRDIECRGFRRSDGLWDVEAHMTDVKSYAFTTEERGRLDPGDPIHEMWMRLTVNDEMVMQAVEVATDKSPYLSCGDIVGNFQRIVGLRIGPGWTRAVKERLGGVQGCTHLVELLGPIATTAFQTIFPILAREKARKAKDDGLPPQEPGQPRPVLINTCHIFASDGEVVKRQWPDHYTGEPDAPPVDADPAEAAE